MTVSPNSTVTPDMLICVIGESRGNPRSPFGLGEPNREMVRRPR
jgi:hypothetical protein